MIITKASLKELKDIVDICLKTKEYFKAALIPQWQGEYPNEETFKKDIDLQRLFVAKDDDVVIGMFVLTYPDHNYDYIEEGKWEDNTPYIAIHRLAIKEEYKGKGYAHKIFDYVKENYDHIRIDTHKLNYAMNRAILKNDFVYRGVIYVEDGTPRNAYEWSRKYHKVISNLDVLHKQNSAPCSK